VTEQLAPSDSGALILPFGKHKGATVAELLAKDPSYADWVVAQGWVAQRFAELHAAILSRGTGSDDTPEHNALQGRFLDPVFREACLRLVARKALNDTQKSHATDLAYEVERAQEELKREEYAAAHWKHDEAACLAAKEKLAVTEARAAHPVRLFTEARFERYGVDVVIAWLWRNNDDQPESRAYDWPHPCRAAR
jgi:hypothetical protein